MRHITLIPHRGGRLTVERKFERLRMEQIGCGPCLTSLSRERLVSCLLVADAFDDPVRPKPPPPRPPPAAITLRSGKRHFGFQRLDFGL
jgi:hypothetical protein